MDYIHLALITLYHVKVTNSRSKSYTLFKLKNYWERRYRCREHTKNVIILRVKSEAYLIICIRLQTFREQVTLPTRASTHNLCRKGTDTYDIPLNATSVRINISFYKIPHKLLSISKSREKDSLKISHTLLSIFKLEKQG